MTENEGKPKIEDDEIDPGLHDLINSLSTYADYLVGDNIWPFRDTILLVIRSYKDANERKRKQKK